MQLRIVFFLERLGYSDACAWIFPIRTKIILLNMVNIRHIRRMITGAYLDLKKKSVVVGCMRMVNRYVVLGVKYNETDVYYMP